MSGYVGYPEYRDSGVEWIGAIPNHWVVSKVKHLMSFQVGWTPPTNSDENFSGDNLWANISDLKDKHIEHTGRRISDDAAKAASMDITPKWSLLYSFKLSVGFVSFAAADMYTNEAIASFLEEGSLVPLSYAYYALPLFVDKNSSTNIYGARILNQELISNALLLFPKYKEAEALAKFLDHETAKIDTLIEKQKQLIKLLKEKRQAVINHAVTKGLNPDAPMKDSGVEWLGKIPAGWNVLRVKQVSSFITSGPRGWSDFIVDDAESVFLQSGDLNDQLGLRLEDAKRVAPPHGAEGIRTKVDLGDVVVCITGANTGRVAVVDRLSNETYINQHLALARPISEVIISRYLASLLSSLSIRAYFDVSQYGLKEGLGLADIAETPVLVPPLFEQINIIDRLNAHMKISDRLSKNALAQVGLLQERRTVLISAVVTGKIDVRNWPPPPQTCTHPPPARTPDPMPR